MGKTVALLDMTETPVLGTLIIFENPKQSDARFTMRYESVDGSFSLNVDLPPACTKLSDAHAFMAAVGTDMHHDLPKPIHPIANMLWLEGAHGRDVLDQIRNTKGAGKYLTECLKSYPNHCEEDFVK